MHTQSLNLFFHLTEASLRAVRGDQGGVLSWRYGTPSQNGDNIEITWGWNYTNPQKRLKCEVFSVVLVLLFYLTIGGMLQWVWMGWYNQRYINIYIYINFIWVLSTNGQRLGIWMDGPMCIYIYTYVRLLGTSDLLFHSLYMPDFWTPVG